ncbi:MAG: DUF2723 domain-containing protein [Bacteroidaceae bacterium]|nr:DUF2723 domain-containing protein [Bacteroidaceae bacterium]
MKQYKLVNNLMGWITFAIAAFTYCATVEPTASFWDCPEFITTGYKLEVGHPPGAPFFMLTANLFSQLTSDPSQVAFMVNTMSALLSALCILFMFWSITHLTRRLLCKDDGQMSLGQMIAIQASGLVGSLAYTWSDTFWFSAVEGEVYAYSSMFTALVFWLILKWEEHADEPHSDRWFVLIAYLVGLSIGVHLLNLLCIPAIVLVFYYKRAKNPNTRGSLVALLISMLLVAVVLYGIVPGVVKVGGVFELFAVNTVGLPFNTGLIVYIVCLVASVIWGVYESISQRSRNRMVASYTLSVGMLGIPFYGHGWSSVVIGIIVLGLLVFALRYRQTVGKAKEYLVSARMMNTSLLCFLLIMVGYSSYAVIVIRSTANTPMDQNSPEDIFTLGQYLNREQYGTWPLFYGQAYSSRVKLQQQGQYCVPVTKEGAPIYQRVEKKSENEPDRYFRVRNNTSYEYPSDQMMFFPRMYDQNHAGEYESWLGGVQGHTVMFTDCGQNETVKIPSQVDNFKFFLSYQVNFMYWRYFMWNFAGRQNDIQGNGELEHGNWITGIPFIDNARLGDQSKLPTDLRENKGHNVFYCLPLILGLLGLFWQAYKGQRGIQQFWVVFFLFLMTGLAIVLYLNQTPSQPRERDYAYAASFYAFAIWIGMGVAALYDLMKRYCKLGEMPASVIAAVACILVPVQMVSQTWDDHDRSGRFTCRDFGQNYLQTLSEKGNPIIYTNGDNDTFPLWYNQETEGVRTDARVCNLSYLQTDWYIDQMRRPAYDSPALPINWNSYEYVSGTNEYVAVHPELKEQLIALYKEHPAEAKAAYGENPFELKNILKYWIRSTDPDNHVIPTDSIVVKIDKDAVRRSGMYIPNPDSIPDYMTIRLKNQALYKSQLMMLEMIANCNWERPIYMAMTVGGENHLNLQDNFILEGLAWRITPFNFKKLGIQTDTKKMYHNLMTKYKFGGIDKKGLYLDETVLRMCQTHRRLFVMLAQALLDEGDNDKALKVLDYVEKNIPAYNVPYNYSSGSIDMATIYATLGKKDKALTILNAVARTALEYLAWYQSLSNDRLRQSAQDVVYNVYALNSSIQTMMKLDPKKAQALATQLDNFYTDYHQRTGGAGFN